MLAANVAVSLVFAALHGAVWPTPIPIFFLSLGLGLLYQRTGGILAPIALHMTFNGVSTLLMFLSLGGRPRPQGGTRRKPLRPRPAPRPGRLGCPKSARPRTGPSTPDCTRPQTRAGTVVIRLTGGASPAPTDAANRRALASFGSDLWLRPEGPRRSPTGRPEPAISGRF